MIEPYPLSRPHFQVFGGIVQQFARFERLIEGATATILGTRFKPIAITMASLSYNAKCDVLLSLLVIMDMPEDQKETIRRCIKEFNAFAGLRNSIAHHIWIKGRKTGTIKPVSVTSRGGTGKEKGFKADEPEYSLDRLGEIGNCLIAIHERLARFLLINGLLASLMGESSA